MFKGLSKCCSNHSRILEAIPTSTRDIVLPRQLHGEDKVNMLGLCWHPTLDKFTIANNKKSVALTEDVSQLKVTAVVASIFILYNSTVHRVFYTRRFCKNCDSTD